VKRIGILSVPYFRHPPPPVSVFRLHLDEKSRQSMRGENIAEHCRLPPFLDLSIFFRITGRQDSIGDDIYDSRMIHGLVEYLENISCVGSSLGSTLRRCSRRQDALLRTYFLEISQS